jgi:rare lipoprotein A
MYRKLRTAFPAVWLAFAVSLGAASPLLASTAKSGWQGTASYYGPGFHGRRTANGERFNMHALTAAHRSLPFGTRLKVTNQKNGRSVVVRVNDRGPFHGNRIIDLSRGAAAQIGMVHDGLARVRIERQ